MAETTAQLQEKLLALTHGKVDIMLDEDTFKSTTQILREMSAVWEEMTDMEQAAALELMGGKRQANILSSVLTNFDIVEDVIATSMDSAGSAMEENAKWLDSIEGKTTQLTNSMQSMWNNAINSEVIKYFLDVALVVTDLVNSFGLLPTVLAGVVTYFVAFKKITPVSLFTDLVTGAKTYAAAMQQVQQISSLNLGMTPGGMLNGASVQAYANALQGLTAQQQAAILTSNGLTKAQAAQVLAQNNVSDATIQQILGINNLVAAKQAATAATAQSTSITIGEAFAIKQDETNKLSDAAANWMAANSHKQLTLELVAEAMAHGVISPAVAQEIIQKYNLVVANQAVSTSNKELAASMLAMNSTNPYGWIMIAISALIMLIPLLKKLGQQTEKNIEKWEEIKNELDEVNKELETTQDRIKELESQGTLSFVDRQELAQLRQINAELERRKRLLEDKEEIASDKVKKSVKKDYEQDFVKQAERTKKDAQTWNEAYDITEAIKAYQDGATIENLTKQQVTSLKEHAPEIYNYMSQQTWTSLDSAAADAVNMTFSKFSGIMDDLGFLNQPHAFVHGETYIDQAIQKIQEYKDELYDADGTLKDNLTDQQVVDINANIQGLKDGLIETASELYTYMDNYGGDVSDPFVQRLQEQIDKIDMEINPVEFYNKKFDEIFGKYSNQKVALYELAEQGKLTASSLNSSDYTPLMQELSKIGITAQDVADHINSLSEAQRQKVIDPTFNIADYSSSIDSIQDKISEYQSALASLEDGTFTYSDFIDLTQKFPELAEGVDTSSKSFDGLAKNLRKAIKNSPEDLIKDLKNLREQLVKNGKATDGVDQLIESLENLPVDAVADLSAEYVTLTNQINAAKKAQTDLANAMSENPNEGYETRGEAMEYMKDKMSRGEIGSESELWDVAKAYGFAGYDPSDINASTDALANFIATREKWYQTDDDGNYTYEGTENFIESVESAIQSDEFKAAMEANGLALEDFMWSYDEATGQLDVDFDNSNWDAIVNALSQTDELASLTSAEFKDLLTQIGQFFGIDWENGDDVLDYIEKIRGSGATPKESYEGAKPLIESYLTENGVSLNWLKGNQYQRSALDNQGFSDDIKDMIKEYWSLQDAFEADPLSINAQLESDAIENITDGLTDESLSAINQLVSVAHDEDTGISWLSLDELRSKAEAAGMDVDTLMSKIKELQDAGKIIDLNTTELDPLGLNSMVSNAETTFEYLKNLGLTSGLYDSWQRLGGGFTIDLPNFVDLMVQNGWSANQISAYIQTLNGQGYTFTYTTEENKTETLNVNTEEGQGKVNDLVATAQSLTTTETLTVNLDGTAEGALAALKSTLSDLTSNPHHVTIYETTYKSTVNTGSKANGTFADGTAHALGTAYKGGSWGAPRTETALMGELGPELV